MSNLKIEVQRFYVNCWQVFMAKADFKFCNGSVIDIRYIQCLALARVKVLSPYDYVCLDVYLCLFLQGYDSDPSKYLGLT